MGIGGIGGIGYGAAMRSAVGERAILPFIGVYDAFSATLAARRFDTLFLSGFGFSASAYALPDVGFISWTDMVAHVQRIRAVAPAAHLLVDLDDGYGDPVVAAHAAMHVEEAGASGIILEDQQRPKKCGHLDGKQIMPLEEYLEKLQNVLAARRGLFVVARSDASNPDDMYRRALAFAETDADAVLLDGLKDLELVRELAAEIDKPLCFNQIAGGRSRPRSLTELGTAGVRLAVHSTPLLFAAQAAVQAEIERLDAEDGLLLGPDEGAVGLADCVALLDETSTRARPAPPAAKRCFMQRDASNSSLAARAPSAAPLSERDPAPARGLRSTGLELAASGVRWSGISRLARRSQVDRAAVLVYHDPSPATMERHLAVLAEEYVFVSLDVVVEALHGRRWSEVPPRSLVVTLDDGHRRNAALADLFAAYDVVPTVFACSGSVGSPEPFWWTRPGIDVALLKRISNSARLATLGPAYDPVDDAVDARSALSIEELRDLARTWIVGAHTVTHPLLTRCTDEEAREEIFSSKREIEDLTGVPCEHFAFPCGAFGPREVELVREAGFRSARTMVDGWIRDDSDPLMLPSVPMPDSGSANRAIAQVAIASLAPSVLRRFGSRT